MSSLLFSTFSHKGKTTRGSLNTDWTLICFQTPGEVDVEFPERRRVGTKQSTHATFLCSSGSFIRGPDEG